MKKSSLILEDVDGYEDEHGGVDDQEHQDGKVEPDELPNATVEVTTPEQILDSISFFLFDTYLTPKLGFAAAQ